MGANFLVIEHYLILALFDKLYVYRDALVLGAIGFLVISGLGSTFIKPAWRPLLQFTGGVFILLLLLYHDSLSPWANVALLAPVAFVTGSFFPALFEAAAENPLLIVDDGLSRERETAATRSKDGWKARSRTSSPAT